MGCDIHFYVEQRGPDGRWASADRWTPNEYYNAEEDDGEPPLRVAYEDQYYRGRSYNLFAILAGVRNGRGFAGISTGQGFNPIAAPRGVPEDASAQYLAEVQRYDNDGHSHSYLTLAELLAYDWTQRTTHVGSLDLDGWAQLEDTGTPQDWVHFFSSEPHVTRQQLQAAWDQLCDERGWKPTYSKRGYLREPAERQRMEQLLGVERPYVRAQWQEPYYDCVPDFWQKTMPRLLRLSGGDHSSVRIVFFFDN